jgi:hypothetical protein
MITENIFVCVALTTGVCLKTASYVLMCVEGHKTCRYNLIYHGRPFLGISVGLLSPYWNAVLQNIL